MEKQLKHQYKTLRNWKHPPLPGQISGKYLPTAYEVFDNYKVFLQQEMVFKMQFMGY